jgi:hypothetical protein
LVYREAEKGEDDGEARLVCFGCNRERDEGKMEVQRGRKRVSRLGEGRSGKGGVGSWLLLGLSRYGWRLEGKGKLMCRGMGRRPTGFGQRERKT